MSTAGRNSSFGSQLRANHRLNHDTLSVLQLVCFGGYI